MNKRLEGIAVSDDAAQERGLWIKEGEWVQIVMADPIYYGRLKAVTPTHYYLEEASWVPDTGRASEFVKDPSVANEVEFIGDIAVERPAVALYRIQKGGTLKTK